MPVVSTRTKAQCRSRPPQTELIRRGNSNRYEKESERITRRTGPHVGIEYGAGQIKSTCRNDWVPPRLHGETKQRNDLAKRYIGVS